MEKYVYVDGKKYRRGYTTGSCSAAATKAAFIMMVTGQPVEEISISTPKGIDLDIKVENIVIEKNYVSCSVKKDGGDDIDATHRMDIYSKIEIVPKEYEPEKKCKKLSKYMEITSGIGIGVITKKGLAVDIGSPAINPVPLKMIYGEIDRALDEFEIDIERYLDGKKILVTIYAPEGEKISKNTFNSNLGIVGGISIIGTTGIVEPMSDEGWQKSLSAELSVKKEEGLTDIILVPGNIGYKTMVENGYNPGKIVKMSNFVGYMLMECKRFGFKKITIAGHIGKLIKLSAGIMNTHSRVCDARSEIMISNLALLGADTEVLKEIEKCITTDAMLPVVESAGMKQVYNVIAKKAASRALRHMRDENIEIRVILTSMDGKILANEKAK